MLELYVRLEEKLEIELNNGGGQMKGASHATL